MIKLFSWSNIKTGKSQGFILDPFLSLIFINDLSDGLITNARLIPAGVSFFSLVDNINVSATNLNSDLSKINAWVNQWEMIFNPDVNKQAEEVIFSRKIRRNITLSTEL